ncbi:hypothetical protein ABW19_dt0209312 [Dactylella cylindrospora]|nr:hypothetical protein ABW19_dt0209312 [Dactylella cylindrospora]
MDEEVVYPSVKSGSLLAGFRRLFSARTLLFGTILIAELFVGYMIAWWHLSTTRLEQTAELAFPANQAVDSLSPTSIIAEDYYLLGPVGNGELPPVPEYNIPFDQDVLEKLQKIQNPATPLFIPYTRNRFMLQQTVLSFIAAGWPREQIVVLENTGTMDANPRGLLTAENPFYLDYELLRKRYGVSVLRTPTYLSFSQLQNFMISTAMSRRWKWFYWAHQDIAVLSNETQVPFKSFYANTIESLLTLTKTMGKDAGKKRWAGRFYNFDWLTLINVDAMVEVGAWDVFIPYYNSDCDWYERARMTGMTIDEERVGLIYDLHQHIKDPEAKFFGTADGKHRPRSLGAPQPNSSRFQALKQEFEGIMAAKNKPGVERNTWQSEQDGGKGEPWTYDPIAFQKAWWYVASKGREVFFKKWATFDCAITGLGRTPKDIWARDVPSVVVVVEDAEEEEVEVEE